MRDTELSELLGGLLQPPPDAPDLPLTPYQDESATALHDPPAETALHGPPRTTDLAPTADDRGPLPLAEPADAPDLPLSEVPDRPAFEPDDAPDLPTLRPAEEDPDLPTLEAAERPEDVPDLPTLQEPDAPDLPTITESEAPDLPTLEEAGKEVLPTPPEKAGGEPAAAGGDPAERPDDSEAFDAIKFVREAAEATEAAEQAEAEERGGDSWSGASVMEGVIAGVLDGVARLLKASQQQAGPPDWGPAFQPIPRSQQPWPDIGQAEDYPQASPAFEHTNLTGSRGAGGWGFGSRGAGNTMTDKLEAAKRFMRG